MIKSQTTKSHFLLIVLLTLLIVLFVVIRFNDKIIEFSWRLFQWQTNEITLPVSQLKRPEFASKIFRKDKLFSLTGQEKIVDLEFIPQSGIYAAAIAEGNILRVIYRDEAGNILSYGPFSFGNLSSSNVVWIYAFPGRKHLAIRIYDTERKEEFVIYDGKKEKGYQDIGQIIFSPDGQHFAYEAHNKNNGGLVVYDGKESEVYDDIAELRFSPDSQHFAFVAEKKGKVVVVKDWIEGREYESGSLYKMGSDGGGTARGIVFSPDSRHFAYIAVKKISDKTKRFIVYDDQELGDGYDSVSNLKFSSDSQHFAFNAYKDIIPNDDSFSLDRSLFVLDNIVHSDSYFLAFSPDNKEFFYASKKIIENTTIEGIKLSIEAQALTFSPSGHYAYFEYHYDPTVGWSYYIFYDNKKIAEVKGDTLLSLKALIHDNQVVWLENGQGKEEFLIIGDKREGPYNSIVKVVFSPDQDHIAYNVEAERGGKLRKFVVYDSTEFQKWEDIWNLVFSKDSKHFAYKAKKQGLFYLALDGVVNGPFDKIIGTEFSEDSRYLSFGAQIGDGVYFVQLENGINND